MAAVDVSSLNPREVAEQLTLMDLEVLRKLQPEEFFGNVPWTKPTKHEKSPNIIAAISHCNSVSFWAITEILSRKDVKARAEVVQWFMKVGKELYEMKSFNAFASIAHAVGHGAVDRLQQTWKVHDHHSWGMRPMMTNVWCD
jgi:son of sevenless-like protein